AAPAPAAHKPRPEARAAASAPPRSPQERRAILEAQVRNLGVLPLLTARGDGSRSPLADLLAPGAVDRPLDEALRGLNAIQLAGDASLVHVGVSRGAPGKIAVVEGLRGAPGIAAPTGTRAVVERRVRSNLQVGAPAIETGQGDPQAIAREVRERRQAIAA